MTPLQPYDTSHREICEEEESSFARARPRFSRRVVTGFTLIELIVVVGMLATLTGLSYLTLFGRIQKTDVTSIMAALTADLRSQQVRAGSGERVNGSGSYGVHIDDTQYVLFSGSYIANDPANTTIPVSDGHLSTTFSGSNIIFTPGNGEISGFSSSANAITVTSTEGGSTKTIRLNRYGVVTNEE